MLVSKMEFLFTSFSFPTPTFCHLDFCHFSSLNHFKAHLYWIMVHCVKSNILGRKNSPLVLAPDFINNSFSFFGKHTQTVVIHSM